MAKVTFILGLAGSGKTHLANELTAKSGAIFLEGIEGHQRDVLLPRMIHYLKSSKDCVVEEIAYCCGNFREGITSYIQAQAPDAEIDWICYENDLESANWNVSNRINKSEIGEHLAINKSYHSLYTYPKSRTVVPITRVPARKTMSL